MIFVDSPVTKRLRAERLTPSHFDEVSLLHRDSLVMRTLSADGKTLSDLTTRRALAEAVEHWERHGFGFWAFHEKVSGRFVGRGGLKLYRIGDRDQVGLAYAVVSDLWGRGLATEMAAASLTVGFGDLSLPEIASWTLPINHASQRVMEKLGFRYEHDFLFAGLVHRYYRLPAATWRTEANREPQ